MRKTDLVLLLALTMPLAACIARPTLGPDHGISVKNNIAMQTLDPRAASRDILPPSIDGMKLEKAMERYRRDRPDESRAKLVQDNN